MADLLVSLQAAGADEQAAALLARDPAAHVSLDNPVAVVRLLASLREMGAREQADALAQRAADVLDDPDDVADLLGSPRRAGADEQADALAGRAAAHVSLDDPYAIASLLASLRAMGAREQADALLARDPAAYVFLDEPVAVVSLLDELWPMGAREQADALTDRLPGAGMFELFRVQGDRRDRFRFGREADGTPAAPWGWEDLDLWLVPRYGPRCRYRRDDLNNPRSNHSGHLFEAQIAGVIGRRDQLNRTLDVRANVRSRRRLRSPGLGCG